MDQADTRGLGSRENAKRRPSRSPFLREPFSGLSHLAGVLLSIAALFVLLGAAKGESWRVTSFAVYGASLIVLYSASAVYHLVTVKPEIIEALRRMDHAGIFVLIAGTYTPVCLVPLRGPWGWGLLIAVWGIAAVGIALEILWKRMPGWVDLALYLIMGWLALIGIGPIAHAITGVAMRWLIGGGVLYTAGAVVYGTGRPRLWPGVFGAHDLWHLFVLAGSAAHFMLMLTFSAPTAISVRG